eukprot:Blabericola_migrator_1__722@NODE_117_length_13797_cov_16_424545_g105_i0_p1_GENE_NODE_117_length_13797_cov_16_424545_g105_i0NODE_117_length_13797_cov_16_424545_g105_i0_p1_ORF_typecomplete_len1316_score220_14_NODE_117_length_13797_cov_16_424545_g105_i0985013770
MRGLVFDETTPKLYILRATALVLVSGRNSLCSGEAPNNEPAPEQTNANNHELDTNGLLTRPKISSRLDNGAHSFSRGTPWFSPDVSTVTTQMAVPSGSHNASALDRASAENYDADLDLIMEVLETDMLSKADEGAVFWSHETSTPQFNPDVSTVRAQDAVASGSNSEAAPGWTSAESYDADLDLIMEIVKTDMSTRADSGAASLSYETLTPWWDPDVISAVTPQGPSGSERSHASVGGEPIVKKARCNTSYEPGSLLRAALNCKDRTPVLAFAGWEGPATDGSQRHCNIVEPTQHPEETELDKAQQHVVAGDTTSTVSSDLKAASTNPVHFKDWMNLSRVLGAPRAAPAEGAVIIETIDCDAGDAGVILDQEVASFTQPSVLIADATALTPTLEHIPAPVPPADTNAAQQSDEEVVPVGIVQVTPTPEDQVLFGSVSGALTSLGSPVSNSSQDQILANASLTNISGCSEHGARSPSHSKPSCNEGSALERLAEAPASTSGMESLSRRSRRAPKKRMSAAYNAAQQLLLSHAGAKSIQKWLMHGMRSSSKKDLANAPYLSSAWLLERLVLHNKVPVYASELRAAFECYGYDNVPISDLFQRALDLSHTLKTLDKLDVPRYHYVRESCTYTSWAAEIIRDAFFKGRRPRADLKTYLQSKIKAQNTGDIPLPTLSYRPRRVKGNKPKLYDDLRVIKRMLNLRALPTSYPLDFVSFFMDIVTFVDAEQHSRELMGESSPSTKKEPIRPKDVDAEYDKVVTIVTKYKNLFKIDFYTEVEALLKAAPDDNGPRLFESAVKEGYVPYNLLGFEPDEFRHKRYNFSAHCLLGSIAALYQRLFEDTDKTSDSKADGSPSRSDLDAMKTDAGHSTRNDGSSKFDVVQQYLLQPLPAADIESRLSVKDFDLLSAASDLLKLWKQDLNPSLDHSSLSTIPEQIAPLIRPYTLFGTPQWILAQLKHECCPEEHEWRRNELQFALDLCGHQSIDIKDVFAKASVLATAILTKREIPFENAIEKLKLSKTLKACLLAADIIHVALFQTWPKHQGVPEHIAKQIKYEVLPEHKECLQQCLAKREEWHPCSAIRLRRGGKAVFSDWLRIQMAKTSSMEDREDKHPLSFDRFWRDVECINEGNNPAIPAIASKYKVLFNRDIVKDLKLILEHAPQICYRNSFVKGIEEGYVPYCWAKLLTIPRYHSMAINNNALVLLGAYVDYYRSLFIPTDATVLPETSTPRHTTPAETIEKILLRSSTVKADLGPKPRLPQRVEQVVQLMAILNRAPAQKQFTAKVAPLRIELATTKPPELHPVARYLLGRS